MAVESEIQAQMFETLTSQDVMSPIVCDLPNYQGELN